ncbi:YhgE/Pip family protein [Schleiferilactobacillus perolens]|uniref:ABC-2 type transporter transmembrane domain-containing protein n=1 Tax=Schleiferilactobacillus perolens DSM 12744 TaxID=1423792 RepID=A0A0R1MZ89_9LACO|nr:YhgE/Pip family protein [Schleiferilactobacillus perolens]KRL11380.1 hypothetical protein FD09_GL000750 [Schleiferilactobacillus perolens DSM 12744]
MFKSEWQAVLKRPMVMVVLFFITLIPAIYSGVYLSSIWSTYQNTQNLPAAIVNTDRGTTDNGKKVNAGQDLIAGLYKSHSMKYAVTSRAKAEKGLKNGEYYLVLEIPHNFSQASRSLLSSRPTAMNLTYKVNPGADFFAGQIAKGTATAIQANLNKEISTIYYKNLLKGLAASSAGTQNTLTGSKNMTQGQQALATGMAKQTQGLQQLAQGIPNTAQTSALRTAAGQLAASSAQLNAASQTLLHGSQTMTTALTKAQASTPQLVTKAQNIALMAAPVQLKRVDVSNTPTNGVGMAPFAISIGLYVGCISLSFMYDMYSPKKRPTHAAAWWWSKYSLLLSLVGVQVILLALVVLKGLGLNPLSVVNTWVAMAVTAVTFITCVFGLNVILGAFGKYLVTILLILQLGASTGVYPIETANVFTKISSPFLPMTYGIHALREAISIGGSMTQDLAVMIAVTISINVLVMGKLTLDRRRGKFVD